MGIGRRVADKKGDHFSELPEETNTNSKSKKNRRRQKKTSPVQKLFKTCKEVFASGGTGIVPPPQDIEKLRSVLDAITPEDVGLKPDMPYFRTTAAQRIPRITYLHIYECPNFSMGIFCLPPSGVIPLHNHPGMTVFSKLLFGTMHIKSYDWVVDLPPQTPASLEPTEIQSSEVRLAKVKVDADFTAPCSPSILYPAEGGNMHCFTAVTACAVLDVLGPPYSDPDGRHCTYYLNYPFSNFSVDGMSLAEEEKGTHEWLQEREKPEDLEVVGTMYGGPKIVES
ncbi:plant cysteine oxidase 2-like isoform X1 [Prosopis cineraria]|uniref:plant cysteine oxidase 2-like isoform X1 n=1 Tax=Prosopis cineraria TaxID=364024 RepID=UPI00240ED383|nr:plant cysteine oxidase 2-like isoform X1 [Prosopis cineraria]